MLAGNMPGLANGLMTGQMGMRMPRMATGGAPDADGAPMFAYGGFARGGLSDPMALVQRGNLTEAMSSPPYSIAAGLINSLVPGRTDQLTADVPDGTYILPADVVSGLGQGNTMAGAKLLDEIFTKGPYSRNLAKLGLASGGSAGKKLVPVMVAGGEYQVGPESIQAMGAEILRREGRKVTADAALAAGHRALDKMVLSVRRQSVKHQKNLPGPKK